MNAESAENLTVRSCPVCGSSGARRLAYRQRFVNGVLGSGYGVVVCCDCGAAFADGVPAQGNLDRYYSDFSKYNYNGIESVYDVRRYELHVDQLASLLPSKNIRILDVGCATGGFLKALKLRGYNNVFGADPSAICASAAYRRNEIEVKVANLTQLALWSERFDVVIMLGVLEHIREVASAVRSAIGLLVQTGLFFASVPDIEGMADCYNAPFQQFSMEHVNFFSQISLTRLIAGAGFAPRCIWKDMIEWREGVTEPIVTGMFHRTSSRDLSFDTASGPAVDRYIRNSAVSQAKIARKIEDLVASNEPIMAWGAGAFTRQLLANSPLAKANIKFFIDSNPHLQGKSLAGRLVVSPEQVGKHREPILILSVAFQCEIISVIRNRYALTNPLCTLIS
jgi:SAM-dependent methyltransferase